MIKRGIGDFPKLKYDKNKVRFIFVNLAFGRPNSILADKVTYLARAKEKNNVKDCPGFLIRGSIAFFNK